MSEEESFVVSEEDADRRAIFLREVILCESQQVQRIRDLFLWYRVLYTCLEAHDAVCICLVEMAQEAQHTKLILTDRLYFLDSEIFCFSHDTVA